MRTFGVILSILAHSLALALFGHVWVLDRNDLSAPTVWQVEIVTLKPAPPEADPREAMPEPSPPEEFPAPDRPPPPEENPEQPEAEEPPSVQEEAAAQGPGGDPPPGRPDRPLPPSARPVQGTPPPDAVPIPGETRYREYFDTLFGPIELDKALQEDTTPIDRNRERPVYLPDETQPSPDDIYFGRNTLKQGNEIRLSLRALADYDFQQEDFIGLYTIGHDRLLNILDGRDEYGALLVHDSETGLFRDLTKNGKYIYTYGPSFGDPDPVQGTILFLPQIREDDVDLQKPSRLSWTPASPPMEMAIRADVVEESVVLGQDRSGYLVRPWGVSGLPCVVLVDDTGRRTMLLTMARMLAVRGVAAFLPGPSDPAQPLVQRARSLLADLRTLKQQSVVDTSRIGMWGLGEASLAVLKSAGLGSDVRFAIITPSGRQSDQDMAASIDDLASDIYAPLLVLAASPAPDRDWAALMSSATGLAREGKRIAVGSLATDAELSASPDPDRDRRWLERTAPLLVQRSLSFLDDL